MEKLSSSLKARKAQFRHILIELLQQEVDLILVGLKGPLKLDNNVICIFLGKESRFCTKCREVQVAICSQIAQSA